MSEPKKIVNDEPLKPGQTRRVGISRVIGWQPMDSIPKTGEVLVYGGIWAGEVGDNDPCPNDVHHVNLPDMSLKGGCYYSAYILNPTHWMPIPSDPQ